MKIWMIFMLSSCALKALPQVNNGARLTSIGNSSAAVKDIWGVQANPSGITAINSAAVALNYIQNVLSEELTTQSVVFVIPFKNNFAGFSFERYGLSEYTNIHLGLDYAKKFGPISIGIGGYLSQIKIEGYSSNQQFALSSGLQYEWSEQLTVGFYAKIPLNQINNTSTALFAGFAYQPNKKIMVSCTLSNSLIHGITTKIGVDYQLIEHFNLRAGLSTLPFKQYAGFGLGYRSFSLNTALARDPNLGYSPQIEINYAF